VKVESNIQPARIGPRDATWNFSTSGNYIYNTTHLDVSGGTAFIPLVDQTYNSNSDYSRGTFNGTAYSSSLLSLGSSASCDGTSTNCFELSSDWTPQFSSIEGYWSFNGSGAIVNNTSTFSDSSNNSHLGTAKDSGGSALSFSSGKLKEAVVFDGVNDYIEIADESSFDFERTDSFSLCTWFYPIGFPNLGNTIVSKLGSGLVGWELTTYDASGAGDGLRFYFISVFPANAIVVTVPGILRLNTWQHVCATYDGSSTAAGVGLYLNGQSLATTLNTDALTTSTLNDEFVTVGSRESTYHLNGRLDEVAIWSGVALTSIEVDIIYKSQSAKYSGQFNSDIIDLGTSSTWTNLDWISSLPFGKELPGSSGNETTLNYSSLRNSLGILADSDLSTGLISLWHFNETAETAGVNNDFSNSSVNAFPAEAENEIATAFGSSGKFEKSFEFDGVDDYLEIIHQPALEPLNITLCAWVRLGKATESYAVIFDKPHTSHVDPFYNYHFRLSNVTTATPSLSFFAIVGGYSLADEVKVNDVSHIFNRWAHLCASFDEVNMKIYIDGKKEAEKANVGSLTYSGQNLRIGGFQNFATGNFPGKIDEAAIWSRALTDSEILELYRRGANRVKFQVRSCNDSACVGENWIGPDGTSSSFFSELHNCSSINGATGSCNGSVQTASASLAFSDFVTAPGADQYFQYRAILESDDENDLCPGSLPCFPSVSEIEIGPTGRYLAGTYSIENASSVAFSTLNSFAATSSGACTVTYQISNNGTNFYYWDGAAWTFAAVSAQSNTAAIVDANIESFVVDVGGGNLFWKAFLSSNLVQDCILDEILINYL
jgi:hypothetical protein